MPFSHLCLSKHVLSSSHFWPDTLKCILLPSFDHWRRNFPFVWRFSWAMHSTSSGASRKTPAASPSQPHQSRSQDSSAVNTPLASSAAIVGADPFADRQPSSKAPLRPLSEATTIIAAEPPAYTIGEYVFSTVTRPLDDDCVSIRSDHSSTSMLSHASIESHIEPHFAGAEVVRDVIVGLSDGLTVPFALAAGLASLGNSKIVVTAGVAEIVAGAISMGLGGYLAGKSEIEHYDSERDREFAEISAMPEREEQEIVDIFTPYGLDRKAVQPLLSVLKDDPEKWVDFMMRFELSLERPNASRSWISAITIGFSYLMGGTVPLVPYTLDEHAERAFVVSVIATLTVLLIFGYIKAVLLGVSKPVSSAFQMMFIGACAAGVAYGVAKLLPSPLFFG